MSRQQIILLILHFIFGIAAAVLGLLDRSGETLMLLTALGLAIVAVSTGLNIAYFYRKNKRLTDRDKTEKVGIIEKKAAQRAPSRQKASYATFKICLYLLGLEQITLWISNYYRELLIYFFGGICIVLLILGLVTWYTGDWKK